MPKVDLSNYEGREQAYVKHCLLEEYLSRWGYKIGSSWDPTKEKILYYLIFATNSLHGIDVFKTAEMEAPRRSTPRDATKKRAQFGLPFPGPPPKSSKASALQLRYVARLRTDIVRILLTSRNLVLHYKELYAEAMALPVVTPNDLHGLLVSLEPNIQLQLDGQRRKKPSPFKNDYIKIINSRGLR